MKFMPSAAILLATVNVVHCTLTTTPKNAAERVNNRVTFQCGTDSGGRVQWLLDDLHNAHQTTVYTGSTVGQHFAARFTVVSPSSGRYDLVIDRVQMSDPGTYTCVETTGTRQNASAYFTVLFEFPSCTPSIDPVRVGAPAELACLVVYNGTIRLRPQLRWYADGLLVTEESHVSNPNLVVWSVLRITATPTASTYYCQLYFNQPYFGEYYKPPRLAANTPTTTGRCRKSITVLGVNVTEAVADTTAFELKTTAFRLTTERLHVRSTSSAAEACTPGLIKDSAGGDDYWTLFIIFVVLTGVFLLLCIFIVTAFTCYYCKTRRKQRSRHATQGMDLEPRYVEGSFDPDQDRRNYQETDEVIQQHQMDPNHPAAARGHENQALVNVEQNEQRQENDYVNDDKFSRPGDVDVQYVDSQNLQAPPSPSTNVDQSAAVNTSGVTFELLPDDDTESVTFDGTNTDREAAKPSRHSNAYQELDQSTVGSPTHSDYAELNMSAKPQPPE